MDLQQLLAKATEFLLDLEHGKFHEVGFGALDRHVDSRTLGAFANHKVARLEIWCWATATKDGCRITVLKRLLNGRVHVFAHWRTQFEVARDELPGLRKRHPRRGAQAVRAHTIENAEVHNFRVAALFLRNLIERDPEHFRSGLRMNVLVFVEVLLTVVSAHKDVARCRDKCSSDRLPYLSARRNILEIRIVAAETTSRGDVQGKRRV